MTLFLQQTKHYREAVSHYGIKTKYLSLICATVIYSRKNWKSVPPASTDGSMY